MIILQFLSKITKRLGMHGTESLGILMIALGCLFIYPKDEWENIIAKYRELPNTKDARNFMRFFLSGATTCEFDKQGRINIPTPLMEHASLSKECVIIGVNERLEVWDKDRWEKHRVLSKEFFNN